MGLESFTPKKWAATLFVRLRKVLVHASVVNRDYEGDIRAAGDTVKINEIGPVDISDYTKNTDFNWQTLDSFQKELLIDQQKKFAVSIDDVDMQQNMPKVRLGMMSEAAFALADTIDKHIAGLYTDAGSSVTALTASAGNILLNVSDFQLKLNEANVPTEGRVLPVPPFYQQLITNAVTSGITATGVPKVRDDGVIINGVIGRLFGFDLLMSNNVNNNSTTWNLMAFTRAAITFAMALAKVEEVRIQDQFGGGVKGLQLYGSKVVRPNAMVKCAVTKNS